MRGEARQGQAGRGQGAASGKAWWGLAWLGGAWQNLRGLGRCIPNPRRFFETQGLYRVEVVFVVIARLADQSLEGRGNTFILSIPAYSMRTRIEGVSRLLFHRYDPEVAERKSRATKGSREKKTDDIESYLYHDPDGFLAIPAINIKACILGAARYFSDPRSTAEPPHG